VSLRGGRSVADKGELLALIALTGLKRVELEVPVIELKLYAVFKQALIDAYLEVERSPDLLSIEETVNTNKVYDLVKGVVAGDGKTYTFDCRDLTIRANQNVTVELNLDPNSTFTVDAGVPYTNSALRTVKQVKILPTVATLVRIQFAGVNLGKVG